MVVRFRSGSGIVPPNKQTKKLHLVGSGVNEKETSGFFPDASYSDSTEKFSLRKFFVLLHKIYNVDFSPIQEISLLKKKKNFSFVFISFGCPILFFSPFYIQTSPFKLPTLLEYQNFRNDFS